MFDFLRAHQLNIMMILAGVCLVMSGFILFSRTISKRKRSQLFLLGISAMLMLVFDRYAYVYRGVVTSTGHVMVRVSNFMVYVLTLAIIWVFNEYLEDLLISLADIKKKTRRSLIVKGLIIADGIMVILTQFFRIYYWFDENELYHRGKGALIGFTVPMLITVIQVSTVYKNRDKLRPIQSIPLFLFTSLPIVAGIVQIFAYGLSLTTITIVATIMVLYLFAIIETDDEVERAHEKEMELLRAEEQNMRSLMVQTALAFSEAIEAKDSYTNGHSRRVADYSQRLAKLVGKTDRECTEIYLAALLHDVGKIGIPNAIINKPGKLTDDEYDIIKSHPTVGFQILSKIKGAEYLSIGAHYHHERYDGKGYPDGLKGEEIPEMARIIAVADAYDAMSSKRSYRAAIPQQKVREEIVKGTGTQFDPVYARLMLHLIDEDEEYQMSEREEIREIEGMNEFVIGEYRSGCSEGILLTPCMTYIDLSVKSDNGASDVPASPVMILFDSLDGRVHTDEQEIKDLNYFEYGEITCGKEPVTCGARKIRVQETSEGVSVLGSDHEYHIEAVRIDDHALVRVYSRTKCTESIIALPDSTRFAYIGFTGEHCRYTHIDSDKAEKEAPADFIPRIAEKISYIADAPTGDIPNVQVDGYRYAHSEGIRITDGLTISFHAMSLPTARLVWHCPCIDLFCSDDGKVYSEDYRDLAFMRLDGEFWESDPGCHAELGVVKGQDFNGWEAWKELNRNGYDVTIVFSVIDNRITISTENAGISINNTAILTDIDRPIYAAVTGDQVAITDIRIGHKG